MMKNIKMIRITFFEIPRQKTQWYDVHVNSESPSSGYPMLYQNNTELKRVKHQEKTHGRKTAFPGETQDYFA